MSTLEPPPVKRHRKSKHLQCRACDTLLPDDYGKRFCKDCLSYLAHKDVEALPEASSSWIKEFIKSTMKDMFNQLQPGPVPIADDIVNSPTIVNPISLDGSTQDSSSDEEEILALFPVESTAKLIRRVRLTMESLESEDSQATTSQVAKKSKNFPVHPVMKDLMTREWKNPEKPPSITKRQKLLFPIQEEEIQSWGTPPKVDVAIARLSNKTLIPVEDGSGLKDPMDRKMESLLKRVYNTGTAICKPALAASAVARSTRHWLKQFTEDINNNISRVELLESLEKVNMAVEFLCDSSIESIKLAAKTMALSTASRRALWLRTWSADSVSKNSLCAMAFEPGRLFGSELDKLLESLSGSKNKRLPQENQSNRSKNSFFRNRRTSPKRDNYFQRDRRRNDTNSFRPNRAFNSSRGERGFGKTFPPKKRPSF
ncbi:lamina-associated polypeptide 2, isoforms alpha/zeta-like [Xenopus laevis]|uniref:Lamina-associated polypeptide 2, isoforms alpha/zeta-like n=2 Tax=Xenopus laevis TaxID=8355 RepID=A0A8J1LVS8_XENLA|nr:lamina-associated polypeptide 2, isoforms alpha/zeta-like isoform X1 [Xenopus laevis]XP_041432825.1 lamina-associated polypeptide 2, isoforms alpha/zeta-like isoform X1 [Xenopus laevis]XP_041440669.1 lamina-associated polypeptide 2, isoforms alpha/zeta-like [Xenopus laevis]